MLVRDKWIYMQLVKNLQCSFVRSPKGGRCCGFGPVRRNYRTILIVKKAELRRMRGIDVNIARDDSPFFHPAEMLKVIDNRWDAVLAH